MILWNLTFGTSASFRYKQRSDHYHKFISITPLIFFFLHSKNISRYSQPLDDGKSNFKVKQDLIADEDIDVAAELSSLPLKLRKTKLDDTDKWHKTRVCKQSFAFTIYLLTGYFLCISGGKKIFRTSWMLKRFGFLSAMKIIDNGSIMRGSCILYVIPDARILCPPVNFANGF